MSRFIKRELMNFTITLCKQAIIVSLKWKSKKSEKVRKARKAPVAKEKIREKVVAQATITTPMRRMSLQEIDLQTKNRRIRTQNQIVGLLRIKLSHLLSNRQNKRYQLLLIIWLMTSLSNQCRNSLVV